MPSVNPRRGWNQFQRLFCFFLRNPLATPVKRRLLAHRMSPFIDCQAALVI